jgi:hypothetical protein
MKIDGCSGLVGMALPRGGDDIQLGGGS